MPHPRLNERILDMDQKEELPYLVCKNCGKPIPLPPATHPDRYKGQGSWPTDGLPRNFACHQCMHAFEYSDFEVHPSPPRNKEASIRNKPHMVVCIDIPCDAGSCASQLRIRILAEIDKEEALDAMVVGALIQGHAIRCDIGHTQKDGTRRATGISSMLDPDWLV